MLNSIIDIIIILLLLFQEFKNFKLAGIIFLNLPLALIGSVFSIWVTSGILSIPAIIGFITLFGIATQKICMFIFFAPNASKHIALPTFLHLQ